MHNKQLRDRVLFELRIYSGEGVGAEVESSETEPKLGQ